MTKDYKDRNVWEKEANSLDFVEMVSNIYKNKTKNTVLSKI